VILDFIDADGETDTSLPVIHDVEKNTVDTNRELGT
jgi:hypothetical protein